MTRTEPVHRKITAYLREEVLPQLKVGEELPTIGALGNLFDVGGVQTVRDAIQPLKDEGFVETRMAPTRRWVLVKPYTAPQPVPGAQTLDQLRESLVAAQTAVAASLALVDTLRKAA
ncbi:hypothetical protein GCM10023328_46650 [Modestobacter marinus]|uniref:DNA-binding transcriptional regulator YhcF (GntR family) n=1 Tax=Modestobacter marinus TaxID=477641 RepID=A0A846LX20_9ACTN|nr:GntR family transcriptional regulator [Modestobacter marinus]NIH70305.1 DNA-binding transcriptional regulator YhcF (GntR family) [Modestobacter marinus]GGL86151.1 hypothetical protein GCM10011589_48180 [Modestobacter marinus]